jgi:diguanylate cyclase
MSALNPITLSFKNTRTEKLFLSHSYPRTVQQGRIGLVLGSLLFLLFGMLDQWSVPEEHLRTIWMIRCVVILVPISIFVLTFTPLFKQACHPLLASLGLTANIGFLCMFPMIPMDKLTLFFPSIALTTVATYFLVGNRFVYALVAELFILVVYNIVFLKTHGFVPSVLFLNDYFLLSANVIGGAAGYMQELQSRKLFLRETELENERLQHLEKSLHDSLTGLPNRDLLHDRIRQALAHTHRDGSTYAAFFIDLDGFKLINDNQGHAMGDQVLQTVAARLSIAVRDTDTVARLGGDEFFVLCKDVSGEFDAKDRALRLITAIESIASSICLPEGSLSASVGICLLPYPGHTVNDILNRADKAMYKAKKLGGRQFSMAKRVVSHPSKALATAH